MPTVNKIWLAALCKNEDDAGSTDHFNLTINVGGIDVYDRDFSLGWGALGEGHDGLEQGQAGLEDGGPPAIAFDVNDLNPSSIRLGIRGDDAFGLQHVLVFAETEPAFTPGRTIALAMETDLVHWLSTDSSEGHLSMPIRPVSPGSAATLIRRVLLLVYTDSGIDIETDSPIQLQIAVGTGIVADGLIVDTSQDDLEQYTANWYPIAVSVPFTKGDVDPISGIHLNILGDDAWLPKRVFVFGLDTESGRPNEVVTLVAIPEWGMGILSTDPSEGNASVDLPLSL